MSAPFYASPEPAVGGPTAPAAGLDVPTIPPTLGAGQAELHDDGCDCAVCEGWFEGDIPVCWWADGLDDPTVPLIPDAEDTL